MFGLKIADRSICASPNVRALCAPSRSDSPAGIAEVLIDPVASPRAVELTRLLQHGAPLLASQSDPAPDVSQREMNSCGLTPPCDRSYWISMSPALRIGVRPLLVQSASPVFGVHWRLLNSKSMFVVPDGSCTRDQYMFRKPLPPEPSW